jgi:hypothetical protein
LPLCPRPGWRRRAHSIPHYSQSAVLHPHLETCWSALLDPFIDVFK